MRLWKRLKRYFRRKHKKKRSPETFPVLKLPSLVLDEFLKLLEPSERFKFAFISKRTYLLCKQKRIIPKLPYQVLGFSYPPMLSLSFEPDSYISFNFQQKTIWTEQGLHLKYNFAGKSICIHHNSPRSEERIVEEYTIYCDDPVGEQMKWARYFCTIFNFSGNFIALQQVDDKVEEFLEKYKTEIGPSIYQLVVGKKDDSYTLEGRELQKILDSIIVKNFLWIRPQPATNFNYEIPYPLKRFTLEKSDGISIENILSQNSYFIDIRNSTLTDWDVNKLIHRWRNTGNRTLKCLSIKRHFNEQRIDYRAFSRGLFDENKTPELVRTFDWIDGMGKHTTWKSPGGFDITRADGRRLTVFVMTVPGDANCHVLGFHVWDKP